MLFSYIYLTISSLADSSDIYIPEKRAYPPPPHRELLMKSSYLRAIIPWKQDIICTFIQRHFKEQFSWWSYIVFRVTLSITRA
jgi:hypothetical protein